MKPEERVRALKQLEIIEHSKRNIRSDFARELYIWEDIAMEINSIDGKDLKFWEQVMELYHEKYRTE